MSTLLYAEDLTAALATGHDVVDLFRGPGGWSHGLRLLGHAGDIGLEIDPWANATARAAGHVAIECDVSLVDPIDYCGARGLIASPPCQALSSAGKRHGRRHLDQLTAAIAAGDWTARPARDPNVWLALEVGRWAEAIEPEWIACEQVPAALPLWQAYAERWAAAGWSTWCGVLNAADYGVPQTRKRAVLIAHRGRAVGCPTPTHAEGGAGGLAPWVPVVEVCPWLVGDLGFPRLDDRGDSPDGYRERDWFPTSAPAPTVTEKARSWQIRTGQQTQLAAGLEPYVRPLDQPSPVVTSQSRSWLIERPATTVACDSRLWPPGHKVNADDIARLGADEAAARYGDRAGTDAIRLEVRDALLLQSFPADYPVRGNRSSQFEQVSNAVPPPSRRRRASRPDRDLLT